MKLYGSTTSPYVRRIRVVLAQTDHEFVDLQIFSGEDRALLASRNPAMKVPCLEDDGRVIFDSRVIYSYLSEKFGFAPLTWDEENMLTLIDAANEEDGLADIQPLINQGAPVDFQVTSGRVCGRGKGVCVCVCREGAMTHGLTQGVWHC